MKKKIKRKIIGGVLVTAIVVGVVAGLFVPGAISKIRKRGCDYLFPTRKK